MNNKTNIPDWDFDAVETEPASSVIPIRENNRGNIEIYLTRRQKSLAFLGGFFVFPGGKVDEGDCCPELAKRCAGMDPGKASKVLGGGVAPALALGFWVAGIRELFEEAGILVVYDDENKLPDFDDKSVRKLFDVYRGDIHNQTISMAEMIQKENLRLAVDRLLYLSHWITPPGSHRRFDTRFFVMTVPESQQPRFNISEISEGFWIPAHDALEKAQLGKLEMILPTFLCIREVAQYHSAKDLMRSLAFRAQSNPK